MITSDELYAIGMESRTAWELMPELCKALNVPFPPQPTPPKPSTIPDPFSKGEPAPVTLAIN